MARPGFYTCGVIFTTSTCSDLQYSTRIYIACTCLRNVRVQSTDAISVSCAGLFLFFPLHRTVSYHINPKLFVRPSVRA